MAIKKVLAVGAGTMGSQASFYYAMNGFDVTQYDVSAEALAACKQYHQGYVDAYRSARPAVTDEEIRAGLGRICYSSDLAEACRDADLVTESVPEVLEIKQGVYADLDRFCPAHTILTTNTSTLPPSAIAEYTGRPGRFLALHYAMGIWAAPVAEVMKHPGTDDAVFRQVVEFVESANLIPIKLEKEQPGYVVNTLLVPWLSAALYLVVNDICSYRDVDKTWMICSGGMPMGPIGVLDQVGFEVARNINRLMAAAEPDNPQYQKNIDYLEKNFISKGHMGALSGKGFYSYPNPEYMQPGFLEQGIFTDNEEGRALIASFRENDWESITGQVRRRPKQHIYFNCSHRSVNPESDCAMDEAYGVQASPQDLTGFIGYSCSDLNPMIAGLRRKGYPSLMFLNEHDVQFVKPAYSAPGSSLLFLVRVFGL